MTITTEKRDLFTMPQGYYLAHCIRTVGDLQHAIYQFDEL